MISVAIPGEFFTASSPSVDLQRSLANRLQARMAGSGSPLFVLTWSDWDMPAGVLICRLRASGRRTSDSGYGGWPTPRSQEDGRTLEQYGEGRRRGYPNRAMSLSLLKFVGQASLVDDAMLPS